MKSGKSGKGKIPSSKNIPFPVKNQRNSFSGAAKGQSMRNSNASHRTCHKYVWNRIVQRND